MKILIISSGRAGSSTLQNALANHLDDSISVFEPTNPIAKNYVKDIKDLHKYTELVDGKKIKNLVEKHLVGGIVNGYYSLLIYNKIGHIDHCKFNFNTSNKFYLNYIKYFDKVILLKRNNIDELAHSWYHSLKTNKFHESYTLKEINDKKFLEKQYTLVKKYNDALTNLSNLTKLPIILYEDLFSGDENYIKSFLKIYDIKVNNFKNFCECLNPKHRYRQL